MYRKKRYVHCQKQEITWKANPFDMEADWLPERNTRMFVPLQ